MKWLVEEVSYYTIKFNGKKKQKYSFLFLFIDLRQIACIANNSFLLQCLLRARTFIKFAQFLILVIRIQIYLFYLYAFLVFLRMVVLSLQFPLAFYT